MCEGLGAIKHLVKKTLSATPRPFNFNYWTAEDLSYFMY